MPPVPINLNDTIDATIKDLGEIKTQYNELINRIRKHDRKMRVKKPNLLKFKGHLCATATQSKELNMISQKVEQIEKKKSAIKKSIKDSFQGYSGK
jgi:predicted DNA-binding ArsR family transcriptional regulator